MFDLDGTLAETMQADEECFVGALLDVFGFEKVNTDWSAYRHTTDSGILLELFESRLGRAPQPAEIEQVKGRFVELLDKAAQDPHRFEPVPGVETLLEELATRERFGIALATGGWKISAQWKLKKAKLDFPFSAAAFADDNYSREGIMSCAWQLALKQYQQATFDSVIYIGDGVWDVRASKNLGYRFVGIGRGIKAERLYSAGATTVFPDYLDLDSFMDVLETIAG
jgi:phosphoglycolate phosphatase-like HAD superfamily hydrolase